MDAKRQTDDEQTALNVLAARLGLTRVALVTKALRTAPVTREAFTPAKETRDKP